MTFLHPWAIWLGAAAAAVPVAVHLLTRPRPVRMPLSTIRFVREAIRQRRARHRLRDAIVLALRTLAVLLLALAVAQPQRGQWALISDREGDAVRVVLLDASQSMAATEGLLEGAQQARALAARFLRYRPGLTANLVVAAADARAVFGEPSANFDALRDEASRYRTLPQRLDVGRALAIAAESLAPRSADDRRRRELVVISDFQRANWARADFSAVPADTKIQLESIAPREPLPNVAVLGLRARVAAARRGAATVQIELGNFSPSARNVSVEIVLGHATWRGTVHCPAARTTSLTRQLELREQGWQSGEVRLVGLEDALSADNVRPLVASVAPPPLYALLTRQPARQRPSSSHFLECALVPDVGEQGEPSARLARIDPMDLEAAALASCSLIVVEHPGKLSEQATTLLAGLLRRGKPILYVAGEPVDATNLKRLREAIGEGLQMPVEFTPPPSGEVRRDLRLASVDRTAPPFAVFGDELSVVTAGLRFSGGLTSRPCENALQDDLLASYHDGSACLVLSGSQAGTLAVVNADLTASNLPKTPAFVPLLQELVEQMLERRQDQGSAYCGEPLLAYLPPDAGPAAGLRIVGPGSDAEPGTLGKLVDEGQGVVWHCPAPSRPGAYRIHRDDDCVFARAVEIPAEESQLDSLPPEVLTGRLAAGRDMTCHRATGPGDRPDDLWQWLLVGCVLCVLAEWSALLAMRT